MRGSVGNGEAVVRNPIWPVSSAARRTANGSAGAAKMKIGQQTAPPLPQRGKSARKRVAPRCTRAGRPARVRWPRANRRTEEESRLEPACNPTKGPSTLQSRAAIVRTRRSTPARHPATRQRRAATVNRQTATVNRRIATAARDAQQHAHRVHREIRVVARRPETGTLKVALCLCVSVARHERRVESEDAEQEATQHRIRTRRIDVSLESYFVE
jgi:hypothetical protein